MTRQIYFNRRRIFAGLLALIMIANLMVGSVGLTVQAAPGDKGGVTVHKADANSHTREPEGDANFGGVTYTITNRGEAVEYNGKSVAPNATVTTITTAADGVATTGLTLPLGTYEITETGGSHCYRSNNWTKRFTLSKNNQMVNYTSAENWNEDYPITGSIEVTKVDKDTTKSAPQGDGDLSGILYVVTNRSKNPIYWHGAKYLSGFEITRIQSQYDESKKAYVARIDDLPYGTYSVQELSANGSYLKENYSPDVLIRVDNEVRELNTTQSEQPYNKDAVKRGGVRITTVDADYLDGTLQGDSTTLAGIKYNIINRSKAAVYMTDSKKSFAPGEVVGSITTAYDSASGTYIAKTDDHYLPYGTYQLQIAECPDNTGHLMDEWTSPEFSIREDGQVHYFDGKLTENGKHYEVNENSIIRGGITVNVFDRETKRDVPLGEAHLDGAVFAIINRSTHKVFVNGKTYNPGDTVMNIATKAEKEGVDTVYTATTGDRALPYGTYEIKQVKAGTGYLLDDAASKFTKTVSIRKDGEMKYLDKDNTVTNQVIREDFHFQTKNLNNNQPQTGIPYVVESLTTGESHIIVTDENGTFDSDYVKHTENTNANDTNGAVKKVGDKYEVVDDSKLDSNAGVWFTGLSEDKTSWSSDHTKYTFGNTEIPVNNSLRAFPYDTYRVTELSCKANEGFDLSSFIVVLHKYSSGNSGDGLNFNYGTVDSKQIHTLTILSHKGDEKVVPAGNEVSLTDRIYYENLTVGETYQIHGEIHLVNEDGTDGGVVAEQDKDFAPKLSAGRTTMDFKLDTKALQGQTLVAFETISRDGNVLYEHKDLADEDQTVFVPDLDTVLTSDLGHYGNAAAKAVTVTDTLTYKNLEAGQTYTIVSTFMDKDTGKALLDNDKKPVKEEMTFVPVTSDGEVDVVISFENTDVAGKDIVAFESIVKDDTVYVAHEDLEDKDQTVSFPKISAFAFDAMDYNKDLAVAEHQVIKDAIRVSKLDEDYAYWLVATLHARNEDGSEAGILVNVEDNNTIYQEKMWEGTLDKEFELSFTGIDTRGMTGKSIVVYPTLYAKKIKGNSKPAEETMEGEEKENLDDWTMIASFEDITSEDQCVRVSDMETELLGPDDTHTVQGKGKSMDLTDTVTLHNLTPGHDYLLVGNLHFAESDENGTVMDAGEVKDENGAVKGLTTFRAEKEEETVEVVYTFQPAVAEGKTVVSYETLYSSPVDDLTEDWQELIHEAAKIDIKTAKPEWIVNQHEDITDENQTVRFAGVETELSDMEGSHEIKLGSDMTLLKDTITYQNFTPGVKYTAEGCLHLRNVGVDGTITDGGEVTDMDGEVVTGTASFVPTTPNGTVDVFFQFDASGLKNQMVTAYEVISVDDNEFASHEDLMDAKQTVTFSKVEHHDVSLATKATGTNGLHMTGANSKGNIVVTDTVTYVNLVPGETYTLTSSLHKQKTVTTTTKSKKKSKKKKATTTITDGGAIKLLSPETDTKTEEPASELINATEATTEVTTTETATEATTTEVSTEVTTTEVTTAPATDGFGAATEATTEVATTEAATEATTEVTTEAVSTTALGEAETEEEKDFLPILSADEKSLTTTFVPTESSGTIDITFTVDDKYTGKTVTAYETLSYEGEPLAVHEDIHDENQTVHLVKLTAKISFDKNKKRSMTVGSTNKTVKATDVITYKNLIPGVKYTVKGEFHVKSDSKDAGVLANSKGKAVTAKKTFTPKKANGTIKLPFKVSTEGLRNNTIVAFVKITQKGKTVASKQSIKDKNQSLKFVSKDGADETPATAGNGSGNGGDGSSISNPSEIVKTGQISYYILFSVIGLALMAGGGYFLYRRRL